jgi:bifunctional non-homologous end joining protein LigD
MPVSTKESRSFLEIQGRNVPVSNLNKVLYPKAGFTKAQVIDYYIRIAPYLLPHLKGRPLTLKRYPEGVEGEFFYEKKCPSHRPDWVETASIWSSPKGEHIPYCLANDLPTLVWAANLADLELHTSLARSGNIQRPTMVVFDLDPGPPADILQCLEVALHLKSFFEDLGLDSYPKTSGSKGLQLYIPINSEVNYDQTKTFAKTIAEYAQAKFPSLVVSKMAKALRKGKVFIDWSQNDDHKTTICVYSLRAKDYPTVSTPLTWRELEKAKRQGDSDRLVFDSEDVLKRTKEHGDLFEPILKQKQKLPKWREMHSE